MKKIIATIAAAILCISMMAVPACAITTGDWDMGAAQDSINSAIKDLMDKQDKPDEDIPDEPGVPEDDITEPEIPNDEASGGSVTESTKPDFIKWFFDFIRFWKTRMK